MTRVALYTRVSTDRQEAENQRRQLRAFVDGHEGWKLVEEYRDEESGATGSRPRFQALFEDAHQRKFEVVFFWALDRFSREGTRATINYLHELGATALALYPTPSATGTRPVSSETRLSDYSLRWRTRRAFGYRIV